MERLEAQSMRERSGRVDLGPLGEHLTAFYLSEMLRHVCGAMTQQAISAKVYEADDFRRVLEMAETGRWLTDFPAVSIYYWAVRSLENLDDPAHFEAWKAVFLENRDRFGPSELRIIFLAGINACIRRMNRGQKRFIREAFDLYRMGLEGGHLLENGFMSGFTYKNIIRIGTALGETDWTSAFFETQKAKLRPAEREALFRYNSAWLFMQKGDFERAMPMLRQLELDDRLNKLDANRMLLKSYFELREWAALDHFLDAFSGFLKRQKDLGYHLDLNLNLVKMTRKLLEMALGGSKKKAVLRKTILKTEQLAERDWLLEKLDGI